MKKNKNLSELMSYAGRYKYLTYEYIRRTALKDFYQRKEAEDHPNSNMSRKKQY